jgi:hypothetical protein
MVLAGLLTSMTMASPVRIVKDDHGYHLLKDDQTWFVKGAVGSMHPELLVACGGNAIRAGARQLDLAQSNGLMVLVQLPLGNPRQGFNYQDTNRVAQQLESALKIVRQYQTHPAVLMWSIGNEPEIHTTEAQRLPVWKAIEEMARAIHAVDTNHPVIAVIGGEYRQVLHEVNENCPSLDAMGLNSYADMLTLPEDVKKQGWTRPYVVTEFGPRGHWQVPKTAWKIPIEDSSSEKAAFYMKAYQHAVQDQPQCLGSFVFYWANKQEKTHTWYGMFLPDGSRTESIDTMTYLWKGQWPEHRCPQIGPARIMLVPETSTTDGRKGVFLPKAQLKADVDVKSAGPVKITWEVRPDVADNPNVGGDWEPPTQPLPQAIIAATNNTAQIRLPEMPGNYRIFVYAHDDHGGAATVNRSVRVEPQP